MLRRRQYNSSCQPGIGDIRQDKKQESKRKVKDKDVKIVEDSGRKAKEEDINIL
ncbi:hypothetical protein H5410_062015 [Solanum commersonii]|uniref:Uncharacterized protein n=1 Tax=Solanum commersonii TaxID=4109 RepID=A0A9J5W9J1_SOLCO|nr:hypothetical protein H5410_062015 [Solanum commersonii]